jgi:hypothetical protein
MGIDEISRDLDKIGRTRLVNLARQVVDQKIPPAEAQNLLEPLISTLPQESRAVIECIFTRLTRKV